MVLRADDGTPLEVKEPVVLDSDGNPQESPFSSEQTFYYTASTPSFGGWLAPFGLILVLALIVFGTVFAGAFVALFICIFFVKGFVRLLRQLFQV